jgi:hypothetical protein
MERGGQRLEGGEIVGPRGKRAKSVEIARAPRIQRVATTHSSLATVPPASCLSALLYFSHSILDLRDFIHPNLVQGRSTCSLLNFLLFFLLLSFC